MTLENRTARAGSLQRLVSGHGRKSRTSPIKEGKNKCRKRVDKTTSIPDTHTIVRETIATGGDPENRKQLMKNMQTEITHSNGNIVISGPFHGGNNSTYKTFSGRFSGGAWTLPETPASSAAIAEMFGASDKIVEVEITGDKGTEIDGQWRIGGYVLASRRSRDYGVQLANGVRLIDGQWARSGGSAKSPRVNAYAAIKVALEVPEDFALRHNLTIRPQSDGEAVDNSSASFDFSGASDAELVAEMKRRNLTL
ncbi:MAG: hypothetical protein WC069_06255 [Candidatus Shapirobacteria bacterium]